MKQIGESQDKEMHFLDHIVVLKGHLTRIFIAIGIAGIGAFLNINYIFENIILASRSADFITFRFFCKISEILALGDSLCFKEQNVQMQSTEMAGQFSTSIWASFVMAFIISFPYILWEIWRFVSPGLKEKEKKYSKGVVFYASFLFLLGVAFGYYVIIPLSVNFLSTFQVANFVNNVITLSSYVSLVTNLALSCGLVFELPIIVYFLAKMGLIDDIAMKAYRKHAIVVTLILSAIITPPDFLSQILVSIPILFLYEVGIRIAKLTNKT